MGRIRKRKAKIERELGLEMWSDIDILDTMHALERGRVLWAGMAGLLTSEVEWPTYYKEVVTEAQKRELCL